MAASATSVRPIGSFRISRTTAPPIARGRGGWSQPRRRSSRSSIPRGKGRRPAVWAPFHISQGSPRTGSPRPKGLRRANVDRPMVPHRSKALRGLHHACERHGYDPRRSSTRRDRIRSAPPSVGAATAEALRRRGLRGGKLQPGAHRGAGWGPTRSPQQAEGGPGGRRWRIPRRKEAAAPRRQLKARADL